MLLSNQNCCLHNTNQPRSKNISNRFFRWTHSKLFKMIKLLHITFPTIRLLPKLRLAMLGISMALAERQFKLPFFGTVSLKQAWHGCLHPSVQSECCSSRHARQKWCPQLSVTTLPCTGSHFRHLIKLTTVIVAIFPIDPKIRKSIVIHVDPTPAITKRRVVDTFIFRQLVLWKHLQVVVMKTETVRA